MSALSLYLFIHYKYFRYVCRGQYLCYFQIKCCTCVGSFITFKKKQCPAIGHTSFRLVCKCGYLVYPKLRKMSQAFAGLICSIANNVEDTNEQMYTTLVQFRLNYLYFNTGQFTLSV